MLMDALLRLTLVELGKFSRYSSWSGGGYSVQEHDIALWLQELRYVLQPVQQLA